MRQNIKNCSSIRNQNKTNINYLNNKYHYISVQEQQDERQEGRTGFMQDAESPRRIPLDFEPHRVDKIQHFQHHSTTKCDHSRFKSVMQMLSIGCRKKIGLVGNL